MYIMTNGEDYETLVKGKRTNGLYYVRPIEWAGIWDNGKLHIGNTLFESVREDDCLNFMSACYRI